MSASNGNGRIHLLDRQAPQLTKAQQQDADARRMADSIEQIAELIAVRVAEHYFKQVPGLVATMVGQILAANGMTLKPPPEWEQVPAIAPKAIEAPSAENVPTDTEGAE